MVNRNKVRGTNHETATVKYLNENGFSCERRALAGNLDKGDIVGIPNVVVECKDAQRHEMAAWLDETETERVNANAQFGILVVKRRGKGIAEAYAVTPLNQMVKLLPKEDS